jgi:hypothetical protein
MAGSWEVRGWRGFMVRNAPFDRGTPAAGYSRTRKRLENPLSSGE